MSDYVMTPARRAALRKAQLISARNRRKYGVTKAIVHDARQRTALAYRQGQLNHYKTKHVKELEGQKIQQLGSSGRKSLPRRAAKSGVKYVAKRAAINTAKAGIALGAASAVGYTAYGMTSHAQIRKQTRAQNRHLGSMGYGKQTRVKSARVASWATPPKSLGMGPKGRATTRQRAYRAKKRSR